jgi:cAMP phosphodiesterase
LRIRLLPSKVGDSAPQLLTTFLIDEHVAIDGGSIALSLGPDLMSRVRDVVVTHSHSDHTAMLPIFIAEAFTMLKSPIVIHGIAEVIADLRNHIFNDHIWPDFEKIHLIHKAEPSLRFESIEPGREFSIGGLTIRPIPVNHTVPCVGLIVEDAAAAVLFTSDTYTTDEIWERARQTRNLKAVFVDVSYPNELEKLAAASKHLTPQSLARDLEKLSRDVPVLAVHIKPTGREKVIQQLAALGDPRISVAEADRVYRW